MTEIEEIASSAVRLKVASLLSERPRTLTELAASTGVTVQAVLKHLGKLGRMGLITERRLSERELLGGRKLYLMAERRVAEYSSKEVMFASSLAKPGRDESSGHSLQELKDVAVDNIILRRRMRDMVRRTARMMRECGDNEARLAEIIGSFKLSEEERQIAFVIFTADGQADASNVLMNHYGCKQPDAAIRRVLAKIQR